MAARRLPGSTYRLQFGPQLDFSATAALVGYLSDLGVTDLYSSPLFEAREGSTHGYDVTDPTRLRAELGGADGFRKLTAELRRNGMGLLLDIVPNHMAVSRQNPWWEATLRYGRDLPAASFFDIDWAAQPWLQGKVLLPVLGAPFGKVLENGELSMILAPDGLWIGYYDKRFPIGWPSFSRVIGEWLDKLRGKGSSDHPAVTVLTSLRDRTRQMPSAEALPIAAAAVWRLYSTSSTFRNFVDEGLRNINGRKGDPGSFTQLERILDEQAYRLAFWKTGQEEINYRRFFNIIDLVSLRMNDRDVFEATHALVFDLAASGQITGLRIDHIDGLEDPIGYLEALQDRLAGSERPGFYVVTEKILGDTEDLPADWAAQGTTGYDFTHLVNALFVDPEGVRLLDELYARFSGRQESFPTLVYESKKRIMKKLFVGEVDDLTGRLVELARADRHARDLSRKDLRKALVEVTSCFPVYRTYIRGWSLTERDRALIDEAVALALDRVLSAQPALRFLRKVLLLDFPDLLPDRERDKWRRFVMRWQQLTGPVMAKGFEDTALYIHNRLVSLNEVGGNPASGGITTAEFHRRNVSRSRWFPHTLSATSTHDTKRGEDVRARISVLSEIPGAWAERVQRWREWNAGKRVILRSGRSVPDNNTEFLLYQTLVGVWPLDDDQVPGLRERLLAYLVKAAREAKVHSSWMNPDPRYEKALRIFTAAILDPGSDNRFLNDLVSFQEVTSFYGAVNSLAQVLLKVTSPGVPDFYQGTEMWDFSLVDPDNRRPVDFALRQRLLGDIRANDEDGALETLLSTWKDGRIKLYLTYKVLHFRRAHHRLFADGKYLPVVVKGSGKEHICAYLRHQGHQWALAAVPRLTARMQVAGNEGVLPPLRFPIGERVWGTTSLHLPTGSPSRWRNVLTGETLEVADGILDAGSVFRRFPVALLDGDGNRE